MKLKECFEKGLLQYSKLGGDVIDKEIMNAHRHLRNASCCIEDNMYDLAVVSVYTAMFHTARALLFRDGIKERSHICIIEYIKEKYPDLTDFARIMDGYRRSRHTMLYGIDVELIADDASEGIDVVNEFIKAVEKEIKRTQK